MTNMHEIRVPHIMINVPHESGESDVRALAESIIRDRLRIENFEILLVELEEEGLIHVPGGMVEGKRFRVAFRQVYGVVVYTHPEYDKYMR